MSRINVRNIFTQIRYVLSFVMHQITPRGAQWILTSNQTHRVIPARTKTDISQHTLKRSINHTGHPSTNKNRR